MLKNIKNIVTTLFNAIILCHYFIIITIYGTYNYNNSNRYKSLPHFHILVLVALGTRAWERHLLKVAAYVREHLVYMGECEPAETVLVVVDFLLADLHLGLFVVVIHSSVTSQRS